MFSFKPNKTPPWYNGILALLMIGLSTVSLACDSEQLHEEDAEFNPRVEYFQDWIDSPPAFADAVVVNEASFKGKVLELSVSYSGGCSEHSFQLYSSNHITLSIPAGVTMWLRHDGNGDMCEAFITETLKFDLKDLVEDLNEHFWAQLYFSESAEPIQFSYPGS